MLLDLLVRQPEMLIPILERTPYWVWGVLAALIAFGISQLRPRRVSVARALGVPMAFKLLSVLGVMSAFKASENLGYALAIWSVIAVVSAALLAMLRPAPPAGTQYLTGAHKFELPGSTVPLLLVLGIFLTKYYVNVEATLQPEMKNDSGFVFIVASAYGLFSGVFAASSIRLWRLARQRGRSTLAQAAA
ncbi:MAG: hypothetical protein EOO27_22150 [Comamonadaceae bacterium]|nr:MAG: hypothetical protein EOO27_22150 [Comamonadaceae bacterium]